ncbi:MAG: reverse transcriptase domain-containing protein [archaeon]
MATDEDMFTRLCSYTNLELAFQKARRGKTLKSYVIDYEANLKENLLKLRNELLLLTYRPLPLKTFILHDPKTRKISKSDFRDRVIHHAVCNIIEPLFDKTFIYDSHANRLGKGTFKAIIRYEQFARQVSKNNTRTVFVLKVDVKHYFDTVDHKMLMQILARRISDERVLWLIGVILANHHTTEEGKGMPLGNLTSQFFANVYLNELDQFVKHELRAKYYIRYVDDFVIMHTSQKVLDEYKRRIDDFLNDHLAVALHPDKSKVIPLVQGVVFLGFKIHPYHKRVRDKNVRKFERKLADHAASCAQGMITREQAVECFEGWLAYIAHANTYKYRRAITRRFNALFPIEPMQPLEHVKKHERNIRRAEIAENQFTTQKTLLLYRKGLTIKQIAEQRGIKESTVWQHFASLIEHHQLSVWQLLAKEKIIKILHHIQSEQDRLKDIKERLNDATITYDELACVLAFVKRKNKKSNICFLANWYQHNYCYRKCPLSQRRVCKFKFDEFIRKNPTLEMRRKEFLGLFNVYMTICILSDAKKREYVSWIEFRQRLTSVSRNRSA